MDKFLGKWRVDKTENYDAYCAANGVQQEEKELFDKSVVIIEISATGKKFNMKSTIEGTPLEELVQWEEGQTKPSLFTGLDGKSTACTLKQDGGELTLHTWQTDGGRVSDIVGRIEHECLVWTLTQNGVSFTQTYKRV